MNATDHYRQAEDILRRARSSSMRDLATAQLHALLAVAGELRDVHNELAAIRGIVATLPAAP